ncbi:two-component sensor histidine kinase [Streptomyces sp. 8K308]|uniref:sensor histidine kinase n=1 Tax=Streptomyces sp. 8K308 TaxID=2530388 RepID=UPI001048ED0C|nr:histidine kinase [Streptomyces sp. 8K308]TDC20987.1 two-component sensor histidine kinase [Streptomyces sp. 8K308]
MTESEMARSHQVRDELRVLRAFLTTFRADLISGAFDLRPLPPLPTPWSRGPRVGAMWPWLRWAPHVAVVVTAVVLVVLPVVLALSGVSPWEEYDQPVLLVGLVHGIPLFVALLRPVLAWWLSIGISAGIGFWATALDAYPWPVTGLVSHLLVMTLVAVLTRPRVSAEMWLMTTVVGLYFDLSERWTPSNAIAMIIISFFALLVVVLVRGWWESRGQVVAQVAVTAQERSQRTLLEERTTIARELHDVVAHHMSVVAIQAEAAPYRVADPPPELIRAFATIRENALIALSELRRVLGVVRAADYEAPDAPQPTLAALDGLLANVRDVGLTVTKVVTGAVRELPQGIELSAYRVIQEALSNCIRHAPGAEARVELSYVLGGLGLRIVNGPAGVRGGSSPGAGHGITGMRERVAMLNGEMTAGPTEDGGYEVAVFVPVQASAGAEEESA